MLSILAKKNYSLNLLWEINSLYFDDTESPSPIIKNLLEHKADINHKIDYNSIPRMSRLLISQIIQSLKKTPLILTPLALAILFSKTRAVDLLVEHSADINQKITISKDYNKHI